MTMRLVSYTAGPDRIWCLPSRPGFQGTYVSAFRWTELAEAGLDWPFALRYSSPR